MLNPSPHAPKTAKHLWSADQLQVMRGLGLPVWVNPAPEPTRLNASGIKALESAQAKPNESSESNESSAPIEPSPAPAFENNPAALSATIHSLVDLAQAASACRACTLGRTGKRLALSGSGDAIASSPPLDYLIVLDSAQEGAAQASALLSPDEQRLLGNMLASKGASWRTADVTPLLKCARPQGQFMDAFSEEIQACSAFLQQHIALAQPKVIVAMGQLSAQALLSVELSSSQLAGELHEYEGVPLLVMPHPREILAQPALKADIWQTLNLI